MAKLNRHKKGRQRILKAKIDFISLCPRGKNQIQTMYKSEDDTDVSLTTLIKGDMTEQGELTAVVYAPDTPDSDGDIAAAEVIKEMAYGFSAEGKGIDIRHDGQTLPKADAFVAESFIIQKADPRFADMVDYEDNPVDVTGGWGVVLKIDNEALRTQYRNGEWGGISMGGLALKTKESEETGILKKMNELLSKIVTFKKSETIMPLTKEDETKMVSLIKEEVTAAVTEALKAAHKAKDGDDKELGLGYPAPVLKEGDTDLDAHEKKLRIYELSKSVDKTDLKSINEFQKLSKSIVDGTDNGVLGNTPGGDPYAGFFTNQGTQQVQKGNIQLQKDPVAEAILKAVDDPNYGK